MYAYSNQFENALVHIQWVLAQSSHTCYLPANPSNAQPEQAQHTPLSRAARYYLYALKAYAFVSLRQGEIERAQNLVAQLTMLDPLDQVGGSVVAELAGRVAEAEFN